MQATAQSNVQLARRLGLWSSIAIVIGVTIGSGIFRTPASIAARVPDPTLMLGVWVVGGLISMAGALSIAELGAALPATGGFYVYLREAWGRLPAFLFGWSQLVLIRATALGGISTVFSEYALRSAGYDPAVNPRAADALAAIAIIVTAAANILGVRLGAAFVGASTAAKFCGLAILVAAAFLLGAGAGASADHFSAGGAPTDAGLFGLALISVLWAYDGIMDVSYVAGEVIEPGRTIPRSIATGTAAIVVVYLAANAAYLYVHPIEQVAHSPLIAADTMQGIFGGVGVVLVSVLVSVSTFGALMSTMLTAPRAFFAMAVDGLFFEVFARIHPRFGTPYVAILLAAALGVVFVFTRTFEQLTDTFVLSIWPFYGLTIAGVIRLRHTRPDLPRPYQVPGYPVVPAVFVAAAIFLIGNALVSDPWWTALTFGLVLAGIPVYYASFRR